MYAYIQRYENDNWITVKSGSTSDTDGNVSIYMEKMVVSGYEYRLKSNAYVYESGLLLESDVYYSASQFY